MKRIIATFLLLIMSLVAVQPTVAFHYCKGHLASVHMGSDIVSCCGGAKKGTVEMKTAPSPQEEQQIPFLTPKKKPCCVNYLFEVSTDQFSAPQQGTTTEIVSLLLSPALFFVDFTTTWQPSDALRIFQHTYPPGELPKYPADLLALICTFRN